MRERKLHYAWFILLAVILIRGFAGGGVNMTSGLFLSPVSQEIGVGIGNLSIYLSITSLVMVLWLPMAGRLINKYDIRLMAVIGAILQALSFAAFGFMHSVYGWYVLAVPYAMGAALLVSLLGPILINRWFAKNAGMMMGIQMAFVGLFGAVLQPVTSQLIEENGWRSTYLWIGGVTFAVVTITATLLLKNRPKDKGLLAYGESQEISRKHGQRLASANDQGDDREERTAGQGKNRAVGQATGLYKEHETTQAIEPTKEQAIGQAKEQAIGQAKEQVIEPPKEQAIEQAKERETGQASRKTNSQVLEVAVPSLQISEKAAVHSASFYLLLLFMIAITGVAVFTQHIPTYGAMLGYSIQATGAALAAASVGNAIGSIAIGMVSDRIGSLKTCYGSIALGLAAVICFLISGSSYGIFSMATFLHGLSSAGIMVLAPILTLKFYGQMDYEKIYAKVSMGAPLASILLIPAYGFIYDRMNDYFYVLIAMAVLLVLAAFCIALGWRKRCTLEGCPGWRD